MKKIWFEHYIGDVGFYAGFLGWNSFRVGVTLGVDDTCIDLGWWTLGFVR